MIIIMRMKLFVRSFKLSLASQLHPYCTPRSIVDARCTPKGRQLRLPQLVARQLA